MLCFHRHLLPSMGGLNEQQNKNRKCCKGQARQSLALLLVENGKRRSKALGRFPTKAAAWKAAKPLRDELEAPKPISKAAPTVAPLIEQYKAEKMPKRIDTRRTYGAWISNHIIPKWGEVFADRCAGTPCRTVARFAHPRTQEQDAHSRPAPFGVGLCDVAG